MDARSLNQDPFNRECLRKLVGLRAAPDAMHPWCPHSLNLALWYLENRELPDWLRAVQGDLCLAAHDLCRWDSAENAHEWVLGIADDPGGVCMSVEQLEAMSPEQAALNLVENLRSNLSKVNPALRLYLH